MSAFCPASGLTQTASATAVSSAITLTAVGANLPMTRIVNAGPNVVFFRFGKGAQTAVAATDTPILAGGTEVFETGDCESFAFICAATQTATVYITPGVGE